ncbi:MAG: extracellular solute-binding protein, partial [Lachnospiraceae bacterium]|nr:extracellular solute-binding protein [Lachnospiraceae bacterium]
EPANSRPVTVTLSHAETGMAAQALQALVSSFNHDNTAGITVQIAGGEQEEEDTDMAILDADAFMQAADSAVALDDLIEAGFDNYEDILQPFRDQAVLSGAIRGIPLDAEGSVLYYNRELFEELELSVPDTADALERCGQTLMEEREMPLLCTDDPAGLLELFLRQNGTEMIAGNRAVFENAEGRKTMRTLLPLLEQDHLVYCRDGRTASAAFLEGRAAAYIGSNTDLVFLQEAEFEVGCAPVFRGEAGAVPARARMLAVTTTDRDRQAGCFAFMSYLTAPDTGAKWAVAAGYLPVRNSAYRSDMFAGYAEYDGAAMAARDETDAFYVPAECDDYTGGMVQTLLEDYAARGVMSDEACRALAEELNTVLSAE